MNAVDWLLEGDPAIRWQALRDVCGAPPAQVAAERARVAREGLGALVLSRQGADGAWHKPGEPDWLPTLVSMQVLRATGADPADPAVRAAMNRLAAGFRWHESLGGKPFFDGETEPCINGNALAAGSFFGRPSASLAERLVPEQLADGGWNCDAPKSACSSFHSTICVLEGLLEYERAVGGADHVAAARRRAEEYLLERALFRRKSTGEVANPEFLQLAFPPRYHYDVLRALDYFRAAGAAPDPRMDEALRYLESCRQPGGKWLLDRAYEEALDFTCGETAGAPSRWNTLRALRVLSRREAAART